MENGLLNISISAIVWRLFTVASCLQLPRYVTYSLKLVYLFIVQSFPVASHLPCYPTYSLFGNGLQFQVNLGKL